MLVKLAECTTRHVFEPESRLLTCIEAGLLDTVMGKGLIRCKDTALRFPPCASCENLQKIKQDAGQALRMEAEAMISAGRRDIDCREMSQTVQRVFEIPDVKELCYYKLKLDTSVFKGAPRSPHLEYLHHLACLSKQQHETVYKTFLNENCVYFDIEGPPATPWQVGVAWFIQQEDGSVELRSRRWLVNILNGKENATLAQLHEFIGEKTALAGRKLSFRTKVAQAYVGQPDATDAELLRAIKRKPAWDDAAVEIKAHLSQFDKIVTFLGGDKKCVQQTLQLHVLDDNAFFDAGRAAHTILAPARQILQAQGHECCLPQTVCALIFSEEQAEELISSAHDAEVDATMLAWQMLGMMQFLDDAAVSKEERLVQLSRVSEFGPEELNAWMRGSKAPGAQLSIKDMFARPTPETGGSSSATSKKKQRTDETPAPAAAPAPPAWSDPFAYHPRPMDKKTSRVEYRQL